MFGFGNKNKKFFAEKPDIRDFSEACRKERLTAFVKTVIGDYLEHMSGNSAIMTGLELKGFKGDLGDEESIKIDYSDSYVASRSLQEMDLVDDAIPEYTKSKKRHEDIVSYLSAVGVPVIDGGVLFNKRFGNLCRYAKMEEKMIGEEYVPEEGQDNEEAVI